MSRTPLAVAGAAPLAYVDEHGYVFFDDGWRVEWWVLGDDYWHVPAASPTVRQRSVDNSPITETAIRVPGGDVVFRVGAAVSGDGTACVVAECENAAAIPVALGMALVSPDDVVSLDVHPVTHSNTWRGALRSDATVLPDLATVARGWLALARQGAHVTTNDPSIDDALVAARCQLLLRHGGLVAAGKKADRAEAATAANALALLGYDDEAGALRLSARLKPARKGLPLVPGGTDGVVAATRGQMVDDSGDGIDIAPGYTRDWIGRSIDVRDLPTNHGLLSFAIRWHGEHPALLWEVDAPKPVRVRATAIKPEWESTDPTGEALLA